MPDYWTIEEVAEKFRVSRMTIYRLVHSGEMRSIRIGHAFRIPNDAVNEFLEESR